MHAQGIRKNPAIRYPEVPPAGTPEELAQQANGRFGELLGQLVGSSFAPDMSGIFSAATVGQQVSPAPVREVETVAVRDEEPRDKPVAGEDTPDTHDGEPAVIAAAAPEARRTERTPKEGADGDETDAEKQADPETKQPDELPETLVTGSPDKPSAQFNIGKGSAPTAQQATQQAAQRAETPQSPQTPLDGPARSEAAPAQQALAQAPGQAVAAERSRAALVRPAEPHPAPAGADAGAAGEGTEQHPYAPGPVPRDNLSHQMIAGLQQAGGERFGRAPDRGLTFGDFDARFGGARGGSPVQNFDQLMGTAAAGGEKSSLQAPKTKGGALTLTPKDRAAIVEEMKELLRKAAVSRDGNTLTVRVDPPELGQMSVRVQHRDGVILARIMPESAEVENVLRSNAAELTQVLAAAGVRGDQVHVSIGRERPESETFRFGQGQQDRGGETSTDGGREQNSARGERSRNGTGWMSDGPQAAPRGSRDEGSTDSGWIA